MVVLELEEGSDSAVLVNNYRQNETCAQLGRRVEVDLPKERCQVVDGFCVALHLSPQAVDLYPSRQKPRLGNLSEKIIYL